MALGTKIGIGVALVAIGGAGLWGWHRGTQRPPEPVELASADVSAQQEAPPVVAEPLPAPEPMRTEPPDTPVVTELDAEPATSLTETSGALASPLPPVGVIETQERSFRARPAAGESEPLVPSVAADEPPLAAPRLDEPPVLSEPPVVSEPPPAVTAKLAPPPAPPVEPVTAAVQADMQPVAPEPATAKPTEHTIAPGDTYSSLALKYLGNARYANLIAKANPGKDPRKLFVGSKIIIPPAPASASKAGTKPDAAPALTGTIASVRVPDQAPPPVPESRAYKVKPGESWNTIARHFLGDANRWTELYELNKERVPRDPRALPAGTIIELPQGVSVATRPS